MSDLKVPVIPPVGKEESWEDDDPEVEILYLSKQVLEGGHIYDFEMSFMSDHQVFARAARDGVWCPYRIKVWESLDRVYRVADAKCVEGWQVTWHPAWQPGLREFSRSVRF